MNNSKQRGSRTDRNISYIDEPNNFNSINKESDRDSISIRRPIPEKIEEVPTKKINNEGNFFQSQTSMENSYKEFSSLEKMIIEKMETKVRE